MDAWSYQTKLIASLGLLVAIWLIRFILLRLFTKITQEADTRSLWRKVINGLTLFVGAILVVRIWIEWFQSIITLLSVIAAALVIINKEILLNLFSYSVIVWRGLFKVGDRVQIAGSIGEVVGLGVMYLSIVEMSEKKGDRPTGRLIKIPNKEITDKHVINLSKSQDSLWQEVTVAMPLSANWQKAAESLQGIVDLVSNREIPQKKRTTTSKPEVFLSLESDKYLFTCRLSSGLNDQRKVLDHFWREVLQLIDQEDDLFMVAPPTEKPS